MKGRATRNIEISFGDFGLMALEQAWITNRQIEAARMAITRHVKRGGKVWIRIFPDKPYTKKPAETRMGKGKGAPEYWVAPVKPGHGDVRAGRRGPRPPPRRPCGGPGASSRSGRGSSRARRSEAMKDSYKELTPEELKVKREELAKQYDEVMLQRHHRAPRQPAHAKRTLRRRLARVITLLREHELGIRKRQGACRGAGEADRRTRRV